MSTFPKPSGFTYLEHTADVWVHAWGTTLEEAFEQTALALMDTMIASKNIATTFQKKVIISERSQGALLIAFLSEFLYLFDVEQWIFSKITVETISNLEEDRFELIATTKGEPFSDTKHEPDTEVKAITYSYLEINEGDTFSEIKIVFDI